MLHLLESLIPRIAGLVLATESMYLKLPPTTAPASSEYRITLGRDPIWNVHMRPPVAREETNQPVESAEVVVYRDEVRGPRESDWY